MEKTWVCYTNLTSAFFSLFNSIPRRLHATVPLTLHVDRQTDERKDKYFHRSVYAIHVVQKHIIIHLDMVVNIFLRMESASIRALYNPATRLRVSEK
jgi:hypothetical protein